MMPTPTEISRDWQTSRPYVCKCIKKGCPTDSFENARLWREANASNRATTSPVQIAKPHQQEKDDDAPAARARRKEYFARKRDGARLRKPPSDASLDDALFSAIDNSEEANRLLKEAMIEGRVSQISARLSVHNKALETRFKAERLYREELERRGILIPLAQANDNARKIFEVIITRLNALPQNCAPRCNPNDPHRAMGILEDAVAGIMAAAHKACDAPRIPVHR